MTDMTPEKELQAFMVVNRTAQHELGSECCSDLMTNNQRESVNKVKGRAIIKGSSEHGALIAGGNGESIPLNTCLEYVENIDACVRRNTRGSTRFRKEKCGDIGRRNAVHDVGDEDVEISGGESPLSDVVIRSRSGRRNSSGDDVNSGGSTITDRDSGLGNDSHIVDTWSTFNSRPSKFFSDSFEFHVISMAALNGLSNLKDSRLLRKFAAGRRTKTLVIETAWPSTVWYVPPPFEDQTFVLQNLFEEVRKTAGYGNLSSNGKHILEAKFEIVSSEATYLKSLLTLEDHFIYSNELNEEEILSRSDKHTLFADIPAVIKCSKDLLQGFQQILSVDPLMGNIFQFLNVFANQNFHVFIKYCSNLKYILETQNRLLAENAKFVEAVRHLEQSPVCERLPLNSFLSLPLGRVVKLDLPVKEALKKMSEDHAEYKTCLESSKILRKFGHDCNEGAKRFECMGDTLKIANKLDFPEEMPAFPISCSSRHLLKQGSLMHHLPRRPGCSYAVPVHIFLFNDLLVVSRKQSDECYVVKEYCSRDLAILTSTKGLSHLPACFTTDSERKYLLLSIVKQQNNSTTEMVLSCDTERDRQAWLDQASSEMPCGFEYKTWNRPQVSVILPFVAEDPSQLCLRPGDEVRVVKRVDDDWYEGVRVSDGSRGVFPGSHTTIVSVAQGHARALRKLYLLLNEETDCQDRDSS